MIHFDRDNVIVDDDFARFGAKSYAINKITSLDLRSTKIKNGGPGIRVMALTVAGVIFTLALPPLGLIMLAVAGWLAWKQWHRAARHRYDFVLFTGGGETMAFKTEDADFAAELRGAIERAMTAK